MTDPPQNLASSLSVGAVIAHRWAQHPPEHSLTRPVGAYTDPNLGRWARWESGIAEAVAGLPP